MVEGAGGVCGYAVAALDASDVRKRAETTWIPTMQSKYPKPDSLPSNGLQEVRIAISNEVSFARVGVVNRPKYP